MRRTYPS